jgi:D-alanyl-D-alanine carboxypeptidase (penicillin-binding protein 5/6)
VSGVGAWAAVLALVAALTAPAAGALGCAGQQVPSPPAAREEIGVPAPSPLPWPAEPVGGAALGACGDVGAAAPATVTAASYVLADLDTGAVLAARAPHERQRPASTLKLLTSLVALRTLDPDQVVDGTAEDLRVDGSKVGIGPGGRYTVRELMQGLLLNSGNDAAAALARAMGGDAATVLAMSDAARALGALDTRPATPSGLDGPGMATSAYDLALVFRAVMRQPLFAATTATRQVPFPGYGDHPGFVVSNTNQFLPRYAGAIAGKAGFTDAARHTLVVAAQRGGRRLLVVLVRGEQQPVPLWRQAAALMDEGFVLPAGTPPVGVLVDGPPVPAATAPAGGPRAGARTTSAPSQLSDGPGIAAAGGTVAVIVLAGWGWRRAQKRAGGPPA